LHRIIHHVDSESRPYGASWSCNAARAVDPSASTPEFQQLIDDMFETMKEHQGVG
jgi:peptide deformylase